VNIGAIWKSSRIRHSVLWWFRWRRRGSFRHWRWSWWVITGESNLGVMVSFQGKVGRVTSVEESKNFVDSALPQVIKTVCILNKAVLMSLLRVRGHRNGRFVVGAFIGGMLWSMRRRRRRRAGRIGCKGRCRRVCPAGHTLSRIMGWSRRWRRRSREGCENGRRCREQRDMR